MGEKEPHQVGWVGSSRSDLQAFPEEVKINLGHNLWRVQQGLTPICEFRPLTDIKSGVWELKESDDAGWYRLVYLTVKDGVIWVLHCFQKNSRKMSKSDAETIGARYKQLMAELKKRRSSK